MDKILNSTSQPVVGLAERQIVVQYQPWLETIRQELGKVPMAKWLGIDVCHFDGETLQMSAPLEPNINDKMTAFGGSQSSVALLLGWSWMLLMMRGEGLGAADVVIAETHQRFLQPVKSDFFAEVSLSRVDPEQFQRFLQRFQQRGRAKITLPIALYANPSDPQVKPALIIEAVYAAIRR